MRTTRIHIFRDSPNVGEHRITAEVAIPGLGALEIQSCLSTETVERIFKEVEESTRNKFSIAQPTRPAGTKE